NLLPSLFVRVRADVAENAGFFSLHLLGFVALAFGTGLNHGAGVSFDGAQLASSYQVLLFGLMVPLAAASAAQLSFARSLLAGALGFLAFTLLSMLAQALLYWARALDLEGAQQYGKHFGTACMLAGGAL